MKKLLLSGVALTICISAFAQNNGRQIQSRLSPAVTNQVKKVVRPTLVDQMPMKPINGTVSAHRNSMVEVSIGQTQYDLQSNYGATGNRVKYWDDNTLSVVWTISPSGAAGFPDRGTGYNYYNGSAWGPSPSARVESIRTGFPNVCGTNTLGEVIVNHGTNPTNYVSRATKGTGTWNEAALGTTNVTWPRATAGGNNGTTVHVIGNSNAAGTNQSSEFYYSRSQDGGASWDQENVVLPGADGSSFYDPSVDGYDIDVRGDVVAIVMGGFNADLALWKSTDNGTTWTKTTINAFPIPAYNAMGNITDVDADGIADTVLTCDSGPSIVIDNNGMVHVAVGLTRVLDDNPDPTNTDISYFPGTDGLVYWNESLPAGDITNNVIASAEDRDGDGVISIESDIASYQCSLTGMPGIGVDALNNIHLVYSSIMENTTNGAATPQSFRNAYYMYSTDGGATWSTPATVEQSDFDEQAFTNMSKRLTSTVNIIYHKDGEPGTAVGADADPVGVYDVIYNGIVNPVGINENNLGAVKSVIYPNPVKDLLNVDYTVDKAQTMSVELVNVLGATVYTTNVNAVTGINNVKINVKNYAAGVYSLNTTVDGRVYSEKVVIR